MKCPNCGSWNQHCIDTRPSKDGNGRRRRRECHDCGHRFNTIETVERLADATEALCLDLDEASTIVEAEGE